MKPSLILKLIGTIWKTRRRGSGGWRPGIKGRARWTSACRNTGVGVVKGNVAWRTSHDCALWRICLCISAAGKGFLKFMRKWEPRWPSISKQSVTRSVEGQSEELRKDICKEMQGVAAETDVAFTTDFWTSPTAESFMTMSMHWITQDWRLKTRIMGTTYFPQQHTAANISKKLMELRLDFGVYPRARDGRPLQSV